MSSTKITTKLGCLLASKDSADNTGTPNKHTVTATPGWLVRTADIVHVTATNNGPDNLEFLSAPFFLIFNDDTQIDGENGVTACPTSGIGPNGPVSCNPATDALGLPLDYVSPNDPNVYGSSSAFRNGTSNDHFVLPREYRLTVGFRF